MSEPKAVQPTAVTPTQPSGSWQQPPSPEPKAKPRAARRAARRPATPAAKAAASEAKETKADLKDPVVTEARLTGTVQAGTVTPSDAPVGGNVPGSGGEKSPLVKEARLTGSVQSGTTSPYYPPDSGKK